MAGYVVPSENKQHKDPGVPSKARIESFFITPKIKFQAGKPQPYPEGGKGVMALATARPKPLDASKLLDLTNPVLSPAGIVANLGMTLADERAWAKFLDDEAVKAVNEVAFRKVVMEHAVEEKLDAALRRAIAQRALVYWRGLVVEKALYIGPRGGKWADPQHTIPWDPKKHAPGRKIHVIDMTAVPGPKPKKQIGLFDKPPTKILGEEGAAGTKEPVKPRPTPAPGPGPALIVPRGTKKREKAVEVGEHVWGSRADLAVRSADDLKELSPEDQAKFATKKNLMPTRDVDELLETDFTPASIVLRRAIESCVQSKAPNSLLERQDYMNGIDFLSRSLDGGEVRYVIDLAKAQARGGKYHRRVPKPGGGFHYIYDPEQYGARRDAHLDGDDAGRTYLSGKINKCLEGAGQKGCGPKVFQSLVKRHGAKRVAQTLRDGIKNGTLAYRAGRFYGMKEKS